MFRAFLRETWDPTTFRRKPFGLFLLGGSKGRDFRFIGFRFQLLEGLDEFECENDVSAMYICICIYIYLYQHIYTYDIIFTVSVYMETYHTCMYSLYIYITINYIKNKPSKH